MCTQSNPQLTWSAESKEIRGRESAYEMIQSQRAPCNDKMLDLCVTQGSGLFGKAISGFALLNAGDSLQVSGLMLTSGPVHLQICDMCFSAEILYNVSSDA